VVEAQSEAGNGEWRGADGTQRRLGSGANKRESVRGGVVGEESKALVPFIGRQREGGGRVR
jgi:hypothetical protein